MTPRKMGLRFLEELSSRPDTASNPNSTAFQDEAPDCGPQDIGFGTIDYPDQASSYLDDYIMSGCAHYGEGIDHGLSYGAMAPDPDLANDMTLPWHQISPTREHSDGQDSLVDAVSNISLSNSDSSLIGLEIDFAETSSYPVLDNSERVENRFAIRSIEEQFLGLEHGFGNGNGKTRFDEDEWRSGIWNENVPLDPQMLYGTAHLPECDGFFDSNGQVMEPFYNNPQLSVAPSAVVVPYEVPATELIRRLPGRPVRSPVSPVDHPEARHGKRPYKENRQRITLKKVRRRIKCDIDGCPYEYASSSTLLRHRQNTHWSKTDFCARCLHPECSTEMWAGTEPKVWDNMRTHQSQKHPFWILGKSKVDRCVVSAHPKPPQA